MAQPLKVSFTPNLVVSGNYVISFTALNPTTGAVVTGVKVSQASVTGVDLNADTSTDSGGTQTPGQIFLVPGPAVGV